MKGGKCDIFKFDSKSQCLSFLWGEGIMNEKFFDLKKEKQDRMINAALKVFALKGYEHASTDDIVKEASISKGLLFHYFISKLGLYTFIYDYSVKYVMLELSTGVDKNETDYFKLCKQVKQAQVQVMNTYPYMVHFLNESRKEDVSEALIGTEEKRSVLPAWFAQLLKKVDTDKLRNGVDIEKLSATIDYTLDGLLAEKFLKKEFQPEQYAREVSAYLEMFRAMAYQED